MQPRSVLLLTLLAMAAISAIAGVQNALEDSRDLPWQEARLLLAGENPYAPSAGPESMPALPGEGDPSVTVQLPSTLMMFLPVALLELPEARVAWLLVNALATVVFLALSVRIFLPGRVSAYALALLTFVLLASTPWRVTIGNGQYGLVAMSLFLVSLHFYERGRMARACLFAALALVKYTLVLPFFALYLYRPRDAAIVTAAALLVHGGLTVLAGEMLDESPLALVRQSLEAAAAIRTHGTFDVFAFFARAMPGAGLGLPVLCAAILVALTLIAARERMDLRGVAMLSIVSIVIVYHRIYDAFVLMFVCYHLLALLRARGAERTGGRGAVGDVLEIGLGASVLAYVFFGERLVMEVVLRGGVAPLAYGVILGVVAVLIYGYAVFLFCRNEARMRRRRGMAT